MAPLLPKMVKTLVFLNVISLSVWHVQQNAMKQVVLKSLILSKDTVKNPGKENTPSVNKE